MDNITIIECCTLPTGRWRFVAADPAGRRTAVTVTSRQACILVSLAGGDTTVDRLAFDWPGLSVPAARSRVAALEAKRLVARTRWAAPAWEYGLTAFGVAVTERIGELDQ